MNDIESSELVLDPYNGTVRRFLELKANQDDGQRSQHSKRCDALRQCGLKVERVNTLRTNILRVASTFGVSPNAICLFSIWEVMKDIAEAIIDSLEDEEVEDFDYH
jgi:hypothetical protein